MRKSSIAAVVTAVSCAGTVALAAPASAQDPTCADLLGIAVHGQHVIGDYVTGDGVSWPPAGQVGPAVSAEPGVAVKGGPGPGFHFANGYPPGASFCVDGAQSGNATANNQVPWN